MNWLNKLQYMHMIENCIASNDVFRKKLTTMEKCLLYNVK